MQARQTFATAAGLTASGHKERHSRFYSIMLPFSKVQDRSACSCLLQWDTTGVACWGLAGWRWSSFWLFLFFLNIHFWNSSFPEPFCKLGTVFSGFPSLRVVSLHLVESLSVLLVPGSFWLHLRPNPIISEIKEKNCIYFQGNSMFCFVFLFPLFLFLVIHNM